MDFTLRDLPPPERAAFATSARLISCLVTESLIRALYFPLQGFEATGFCVLLSGSAASSVITDRPYNREDILGVVPLRYIPVFKHDASDPRGKEIGLLDPLDMVPLVLELSGTGPQNGLVRYTDFRNHRHC